MFCALFVVVLSFHGSAGTKDRAYGSDVSDAEFYHDADAQLSLT